MMPRTTRPPNHDRDAVVRVGLYARYSSDLQSPTSIEDQFRECRESAAREHWEVVDVYSDAAISGASVILRPGLQTLLKDAQRGKFDIVLAEALDRLSRDQADIATLFKQLCFLGVRLITLAEGEISELHIGLKGTMNAVFLKDLGQKVRRGQRGRVENGKSGGGLSYGYDVERNLNVDARGRLIRGDRKINQAEAEIIRRVFREFAAGMSPRAIAKRLYDEKVPPPRGGRWTDSTIRGHARRGTGLIHNELYIGKLVWNRMRYLKNPETGKRVSRLNPPEKWTTADVPELRIVDDKLWLAVKAKQTELEAKYAKTIAAVRAHHATRAVALNGAHRPRYLLSGSLVCGSCGGPYRRGQNRYACSNHVMSKSCSNTCSIARQPLEARVLAGIRGPLMESRVAAEAMRAYVEETNHLNRQRGSSRDADRKALAEIEKKRKEIVFHIENGDRSRSLRERLAELETNQDELTERLSRAPVDIYIHPNIVEMYRRKIERLAEALQRPQERDEAATAIRAIIERIVLNPGPKRGEVVITVHSELGALLEWMTRTGERGKAKATGSGVSASVVAGVGFEPTTFRL